MPEKNLNDYFIKCISPYMMSPSKYQNFHEFSQIEILQISQHEDPHVLAPPALSPRWHGPAGSAGSTGYPKPGKTWMAPSEICRKVWEIYKYMDSIRNLQKYLQKIAAWLQKSAETGNPKLDCLVNMTYL